MKTQEEYIEDFKKVHGNRYDYSKVSYKNSTTLIEIICKIHGSFWQRPANHKYGQGCRQCGVEASNKNSMKTQESWISRAITKHGKTYTYSNSIYKGSDLPITITCRIHGDFQQDAKSHLKGHGCKLCAQEQRLTFASSGKSKGFIFYLDKPTKLYYVRINSPEGYLYKIGITTKTIKERFMEHGERAKGYKLIALRVYHTGELAFKHEQKILQEFNHKLYTGQAVLRKGNSELFIEDVLNGKL